MKKPGSSFIIFLLSIIIMVANSNNCLAQEQVKVPIKKMANGRIIHRFFDTSPLSPSGKFLALFRFPYEDHSPVPGDAGDVVIVDMKSGKERVVAKSRGWEMQLGAQVQWGASDSELYFNDVDTTTWKAFAVQLNPATGAIRRMDGTVFMVSHDGKQLVSYNLILSRYAQVGYGVIIPKQLTKENVGPVDNDGVYVTDVKTGKCRMIVSIQDIYNKTVPSIKIANPEQYHFYCFQVKWNPQDTKILTTVQWTPLAGGARRRAVITMNADGSDLRTAVTPDQWAKGGHHINWAPDGDHLTMNLDIDGKPGLELASFKYDGTEIKTIFKPGSGHPSFNPTGIPFVITDAYPDEPISAGDGTAPLRLLNIAAQKEQDIAKVFLSNTTGEFRVDEHPAWDLSGRYVIFNGFTNHTRCVYIADLKNLLHK